MVAKEFDDNLRSIVQMDYGLVLISHAIDKTFTDEQGKEFNRIVPTLDKRAKNIVSRMVDIYGYARGVTDAEGNNVIKLFLRGTPRFEAGCRFKYTPDYIDFSYTDLVAAVGEAIDKQMEEDGIKFTPCDYSKIFREKEGKYQKANQNAKEFINVLLERVMEPNVSKEELKILLDRLEVKE